MKMYTFLNKKKIFLKNNEKEKKSAPGERVKMENKGGAE